MYPKNQMAKKVVLFLFLNFAALWLGSLATSSGVASDWYQNLEKAPWTPPGWVFGVAWSFIMICFAFYMAILITKAQPIKTIILLYAFQLLLNISWNPVFFYFQETILGLIIILSLTLLIGYFFLTYRKEMGMATLFLSPYFIWLLLASSLNFYIVINN